MRGKATFPSGIKSSTRITPAYAGKSTRLVQATKPDGDHPRLCGEKLVGVTIFVPEYGSPPPMRGKDTGIHLFYHAIRITPAYAGKSR